jgi:hypothetical protein
MYLLGYIVFIDLIKLNPWQHAQHQEMAIAQRAARLTAPHVVADLEGTGRPRTTPPPIHRPTPHRAAVGVA